MNCQGKLPNMIIPFKNDSNFKAPKQKIIEEIQKTFFKKNICAHFALKTHYYCQKLRARKFRELLIIAALVKNYLYKKSKLQGKKMIQKDEKGQKRISMCASQKLISYDNLTRFSFRSKRRWNKYFQSEEVIFEGEVNRV